MVSGISGRDGFATDKYLRGTKDERLSWGAIIAGAVCAIALLILFTLLTAGLGLGLVDDDNPSGVGWGSGLFFAVTSLISLFVGGLIAGRLSGVPLMPSAVLHGVVVWGLVTIGAAWVGVSATGAVLSGATQAVSAAGSAAGSVAGNAAQAVGGAVSSIAPDMEDLQLGDLESLVPPSVERDLRQILGPNATPQQLGREVQSITDQIVDQNELRQARQIIVSSGREILRNPGEASAILQQAIDRLTAPDGLLGGQQFDELQGELQQRYGISQQQSAEVVERWRTEFLQARDTALETYRETADTVAQELNDAATAAADAAQQAADTAASVALWGGLGLLLGLVAAAGGAMLGRPHEVASDRVTVERGF